MERILLYDEYRLIERSDTEVHGAWKGAHLLFFFLAFVFGSFCTFCFHMMMYLFDEKCVLFPKLLSHASLHHSVMHNLISPDNTNAAHNISDAIPVDFLRTQWVERSTCYLPTYVPLVSGICGLVWTTMFLMCSTGSRTLTGLQRPWRVLPLVFVFSLVMGSVCVYSSIITHYGLNELCRKLGEITGTSTCTYTINVATLVYRRRIHGVYQATQLTIISAWLHTSCWLLSALLALARVILVIDFQLVRVSAHLQGDFEKMLERHENLLRTVSPDINLWKNNETQFKTSPLFTPSASQNSIKYFTNQTELKEDDISYLTMSPSELLYVATEYNEYSELSLVLEERNKMARMKAYESVTPEHKFIVEMLYDLTETITLPDSVISMSSSSQMDSDHDKRLKIVRQFGKAQITLSHDVIPDVPPTGFQKIDGEEVVREISQDIKSILQQKTSLQLLQPSTSKRAGHAAFESTMNITPDMKRALEQKHKSGSFKQKIKSNLKHIGVQTTKKKKKKRNTKQKVKISDAKRVYTIDDKVDGKTSDQTDETSVTSEEASKETASVRSPEADEKIIKVLDETISEKNRKRTDKVDKETDEETDKKTKTDKKEKQD